jgi:hypothetical protein
MRRVATALALALCLLGCSGGEQVPLITVEPVPPGCCLLLYAVVDVVADPSTGTPTIKGNGLPLKWPMGYTAWRVGSEVQVLDGAGSVVLTTGSRYRIEPTYELDTTQDQSTWVVGDVKPCADCELGGGTL